MKAANRLIVAGCLLAIVGWMASAAANSTNTATGEVIEVKAPYGAVRVETGGVKEIRLASPSGGDATVQAVNGSRVSGTLSGPSKILARKTDGAASPNFGDGPWDAPLYFIIMQNGDYLNGSVRAGSIAVHAGDAADTGSLGAMRGVEFAGEAEVSPRVRISAGGALDGAFRLEDIALVLEASPEIQVYDRRGDAGKGLRAKDGAPEPMQLIRMDGSRMVGYCVNQGDGVRVRNVSSGMPADRGGMQVGDWVLSIDGKPVSEGYDIWKPRDAVTSGEQQHVLLETRRGGAARWYLIVK